MKMVRKIDIATANVVSSNVAETIAAYGAATVYTLGQTARDDAVHRVYESLQGASMGTATMSIASPCVVTRVAHGLAADTPICFTTTGALPTGLVAGTIYYVKSPAADTFNLAASPGGAAIITSGSQSGTHTLYSNPNVGKALSDAAFWLDIGPTNPWAMHDEMNSSQTTHADSIDTTLSPGSRVDHLGLLNMFATSVQVIATDAVDGEVYNQTFDLVSTSGIVDWYTYFTEPVEVETDKVIQDLPALYSDLTIQVILSYPGEDVRLGALILGLAKVIGGTEFGATTGIINYSRKTIDDFGNTSITERGYANKGNFTVLCDNANIVAIQRVLAEFRATPVLYVGTDNYANTFIYGFYRDFVISIDLPLHSYCKLEIEGLI